MLDIRYHLFYMTAIFLMLGVGILFGTLVYGPIQVHHQSQFFAALRDETNKVVLQRDEARDRLAKDEDVIDTLRPALVKGKLSGKRVILIQTGDYPDATQAANTALGDAGATVAATVVLTDKWQTLAAAPQSLAFTSLAALLSAGTDAAAANQTTLQSLQAQELMTVSGDLSKPCTLFVVIGGGHDENQADTLDAPLLSAVTTVAPNAVVAGCEPFTALVSSISVFQQAGIATIDCIDLPLGQLALPLALRGEKGDYGIKATARQQLPNSLKGASGL